MSNILNSIKLDYYILKSSDLRRITIVGIVPLVAGFLSKNPPVILGLTMTLCGFVISIIFATAEKSNLNKLYGILPVTKQETVIGRYLFTLLAAILIAVIATIFSYAAAAILNIPLTGLVYAAWLCSSFLLFSVLVATQFPLYFKYDFSKLASFASLPYVILFLAGSYLIRKEPQLFTQALKFFVQNQYMVWVIGLGGSLVLLCISMLVAIELYKTKEL